MWFTVRDANSLFHSYITRDWVRSVSRDLISAARIFCLPNLATIWPFCPVLPRLHWISSFPKVAHFSCVREHKFVAFLILRNPFIFVVLDTLWEIWVWIVRNICDIWCDCAWVYRLTIFWNLIDVKLIQMILSAVFWPRGCSILPIVELIALIAYSSTLIIHSEFVRFAMEPSVIIDSIKRNISGIRSY